MKRNLLISVGLLVILFFIYSMVKSFPFTTETTQTRPQPTPPQKQSITLTATGDILMHNTVIDSGKQPSGYQYDHLFQPVKKYLAQGDYTSACLEAALAGPDTGYTGYPLFNAPDELASSLKNSGFDLIATASNHCLDRGAKGALRTLDVLQKAGLDTAGTYRSLNERQTEIVVENIRDVKVGYLAYTYGTNGIPIPTGQEYLVNLIDEKAILTDVKKMRPEVDVLIVILHWGVEYSPYPTEQQQKMAVTLFENGVDAILGSHPHVLQPYQSMTINGKKHFVIYSMGNSISNQRGVDRNRGVILSLTFEKNFDTNKTVLKQWQFIPTYSHAYYTNGKRYFRVVPVEETIAAIENGTEPYLQSSDLPILKGILNATTRDLNRMQ